VTAVETGKGRGWDGPKIMQLTGGDKITARLMRQDFFDFTPEFKIEVAGNHKPRLRSINEAIKRRLQLTPFTVTIPEDERDRELPDKLKAEWAGILAWMVEGCLEWQRQGLAPPAAVTEATEAYLEAQDDVAEFLAQYCTVKAGATVASSALFAAWRQFCEERNENPRHQSEFKDELEQRGFRCQKKERTAVFHGLELSDTERKRQERQAAREQQEREKQQQAREIDEHLEAHEEEHLKKTGRPLY